MWTINTHATLRLASLAAKGMLRKRNGRIILIGSRAGSAGLPGQADYAATKAALSAWVASAAWEFGPFGITVNVVAPGALEPDWRAGQAVYSQEENESVAGRTAVRRLGTASEIAATVVFLASPAAAFLTGQTIAVDGGARW
jgi:3-oxoacyl-[acyl-carrier protein] reductase